MKNISDKIDLLVLDLREAMTNAKHCPVASPRGRSLLRDVELSQDARAKLFGSEIQTAFEHAITQIVVELDDPTALSAQEAIALIFHEVLNLLFMFYPSEAANEVLAATAICAEHDDGSVFDEFAQIFSNVSHGESAFGSDEARNRQVAIALEREHVAPRGALRPARR